MRVGDSLLILAGTHGAAREELTGLGDVAVRVDRLRDQLTQLGERRKSDLLSTTATHTDFYDFSENTGPGDREPNFNDFVD
jgi:hypothetical protein